MANKQHNALTGASLHEPKGVAAASADFIYAAGGSGSGTHRKVTHASMDKTSVKNVNLIYLTYEINDVSTGKSMWLACPKAGSITKIWSVLHGTIATADVDLTFEIGGTLVTNGIITIAFSGSVAGDLDNSTPSAANVLTAGQAIEIITDGQSTNSINVTLTFEIDVE